MAKLDVVNIEKKKVGEVDISDQIFPSRVNMPLLHEAITTVLANKRSGTASAKTRGEVAGSNVKPYRQKGTGRARHGSWTSPLFVGGGITFGPKPRDYSLKMNKKKRHAALKSALSAKIGEGKLIVIDKWVEKKKTKEMTKIFETLGVKDALIVLSEPTEWIERTTGNIPHIELALSRNLNAYNVIRRDFLVCTKDVLAEIEEGLKT